MIPRKITNYNGTLTAAGTVTIAANLSRATIKIMYWDAGAVSASNPALEIYGAGYPSGTPLIFKQKEVTADGGLILQFDTTAEITLKNVRSSTTGYYNISEVLFG